jgi:large subunit ribosomal protein L11
MIYMGKKETIESLVRGGHASAAPPLGPALGPLGVNISDVINRINEKTEIFDGMEVPVKVIIDSETKKFDIVVGTPPVSSMLKKELKVQKLATINEDKTRNIAGNISFDKIISIAKAKEDSITGNMRAKVKQVLGTCLSCGVTVDGKDPREVIKAIDSGELKIE